MLSLEEIHKMFASRKCILDLCSFAGLGNAKVSQHEEDIKRLTALKDEQRPTVEGRVLKSGASLLRPPSNTWNAR